MNKEEDKDKCRVCGAKTRTVFNINMKAVPICHKCATLITKQNVINEMVNLEKEE